MVKNALVLMRTRGDTAMMAAERGQRSFRERAKKRHRLKGLTVRRAAQLMVRGIWRAATKAVACWPSNAA
jgi:hypothetical protein